LDIINKYPSIYINPNPDNIEISNYCNLRYGFEFKSGWANLVDEFSSTCESIVNALKPIQPDVYIKAFIFKQKFGKLTWQGNHNLKPPFDKLFNTYVSNIEMRSTHICEITGKYGVMRTIHGWMQVLCDEEYQKRLNFKKKYDFK
jgi:hypothetical protein